MPTTSLHVGIVRTCEYLVLSDSMHASPVMEAGNVLGGLLWSNIEHAFKKSSSLLEHRDPKPRDVDYECHGLHCAKDTQLSSVRPAVVLDLLQDRGRGNKVLAKWRWVSPRLPYDLLESRVVQE